jgi:hypothetical protein
VIDEASIGTLFYRLIISPDPNNEDSLRDLNLAELTKQTIAELETRLKTQIQFAAVEHNDHAPHRHVHVLALLSRKLKASDINFLRVRATAATQLQRRVLELKQERSRSPELKFTRKKPVSRGVSRARNGQVYSAPPRKTRQSCPSCGEGYSAPMRKISTNLHKCTSCGIVVRQNGLTTEIEQRPGWGREITFNSSL